MLFRITTAAGGRKVGYPVTTAARERLAMVHCGRLLIKRAPTKVASPAKELAFTQPKDSRKYSLSSFAETPSSVAFNALVCFYLLRILASPNFTNGFASGQPFMIISSLALRVSPFQRRYNLARFTFGLKIKTRLGAARKVGGRQYLQTVAALFDYTALSRIVVRNSLSSIRLRTKFFSLNSAFAHRALRASSEFTSSIQMETGKRPNAFTDRAFSYEYNLSSQGVNLLRLGLALVRPVQSLTRLFGPFCILAQEVIG